jgi:hypothetical protein
MNITIQRSGQVNTFFLDGPLGTGQDTRRTLDLQPEGIVEATGALLLNDERRLRPARRPGPGARPGPVCRRGIYVQQPTCMECWTK